MTTLKPPFTAKDMKSLYMKVIKGSYPTVPSTYSTDLADVIKMCLQTSPLKRPTAEVLIETKQVLKHLTDVKDSVASPELSPKTNLLNTIKLPKKLIDITKRLPKANYSSPQYTLKKKILDIKIAKGLPEIFEKPSFSQLSNFPNNPTSLSKMSESVDESIIIKDLGKYEDRPSNEISLLLRNRLYKRVVKPTIDPVPSVKNSEKIKLPKIERVRYNHSHNYSVNYSCRSLSHRRPL